MFGCVGMSGGEGLIKMISVIMTVFNGEKYLQQSVDSILSQTNKDWELIIVDDASTDRTFHLLMDYRWETLVKLSEIPLTLIKLPKNIGHTQALNKALKEAKGDYIAWMDADDISEPTRFEEQLKCFTGNVGIVSTHGISINENGKRIKNWYTDKAQRRPELEIKMRSGTDWHVMGPSMMWKREVVDKIGGFDEEMYFCQDHNYWLRAIQHFDWAVCRMELYRLRRHSGSVRKKMPKDIDWAKKSVERAQNENYFPI